MKETKAAVLGILALFDRYDIHATWATVGLLATQNIAVLKTDLKNQPIPYVNSNYSPFPLSIEKYGDFDPEILLGREEIDSILNQKNQELASHTFSHFYCSEAGVSLRDFELDCQRMGEVAQKLSLDFKTIIFPRNQISKSALAVLKKENYSGYRGNQENRYWRNSSFEQESFLKKMMRVLDAYIKISRTKSYQIQTLPQVEGLLNIPANRFLRPHSGKKWVEIRKIKRIKREMLKAAKKKTVYHIWWHPHNFNAHLTESLGQLEELLAYQHVLNNKYGFDSLNMSEITAHAKS